MLTEMCAVAGVGGMRQFAPSGSTVTAGMSTIVQVGSSTIRLCTDRPNGQAVGWRTFCVAHWFRKSSTFCCTTFTNAGVGCACTSTGTTVAGASARTLMPFVAAIAVSTPSV